MSRKGWPRRPEHVARGLNRVAARDAGVARRHTRRALVTALVGTGKARGLWTITVSRMARQRVRPGEATAFVSVRLAASDREALRRLGALRGTSLGAEVRAAIAMYLDAHADVSVRRTQA